MPVVVITGANREIGLGLAKIYRARGDQVIACVRETSGELEAAGSEIHAGIDLREPHAIAKFANSITENTIDLLINNAATFNDRGPIDEVDIDLISQEIQVNVLGPLQLTRDLLGALKDGGKIAFISSSMGSIEENELGLYYGYRMSKT